MRAYITFKNVLVLAVVIIVIVAGVWLYQAEFAKPVPVIVPIENSAASIVPKTNPFETNTNPYEGVYINPFSQ